ncbi:FixH family protein [Fulvivirga ligni]|uniref:FixH family protein n=1 Tax=Fulvivirga ligni TaxID=2904246 RepID=UPI001F279C8C|nr:FixH family protein [Fulvivirga ligni]UII19101.1 FixH family protein [Fulvivirga ligni]
MNWNTIIIIAFVGFVGLIATLVTISMKQDVSLVAQDYYVQEIAYQKQIERIKNTKALGDEQLKVLFNKEAGFLSLSMANNDISQGEVHFFRPSDATKDKKFILRLNDDGQQGFDLSDFQKGKWTLKINWNKNGKEYYEEQTIII